MTHEQAITALVALDVAKWGETERVASERLNRKNYPTLGLALNRLAYYDIDNINETLAAEANLALTGSDWSALRRAAQDD